MSRALTCAYALRRASVVSCPPVRIPRVSSSLRGPGTPGHLRRWSVLLFLALSLGCFMTACQGCRGPTAPGTPDSASAESPSARLYLVSDLAGALEPCGCVKDQLGGMDHFGGLV